MCVCVPEQVIGVGEPLQQEAEYAADGCDGGLREGRVPQCEQQLGNQLELTQQLRILRRLAGETRTHTYNL